MASRATMAKAMTLLVLFSITVVGHCSRASGMLYASKSPPRPTIRVLTQDLYATDFEQSAPAAKTEESHSKLSDFDPIPIRSCGRLCAGAFRTMLPKGPVPPSGPSHRGNAMPKNR